MSCIFCKTSLNENCLFCSPCGRERLTASSPGPVSSLPEEGQLLTSVIKDKYKNIKFIHHDSLWQDYLAESVAKPRTDCIRVLPFNLVREKTTTNSIHNSVKGWAKVKIKNLLKPIGSGKSGQLYFTISNCPQGIRLSDLLVQERELPLWFTLKIVRSLCEIVKQLHHKNFIHLNLKPSSVFVNALGQTQLGNVGLINPLPQLYLDNTVPTDISLYASPEQLKGEQGTVQTDLYSLALVAYHLVTALNPFAADKEINIVYKNLHEQVIPPLALNSQVPLQLSNLIVKNLNKQPQHRSRTVHEILTTLEELQTEIKSPSKIPPEMKTADLEHLEETVAQGKAFYLEHNYKHAVHSWEKCLLNDPSNFAVQKYKEFAQYRLKHKKDPLK